MESRTERVVLETERYRIVGELTLPREGYRSRLSDYLNRGELDFIPVANAELTPLNGGPAENHPFIAVGSSHVHLAFPDEPE